MAKRGRKPKEKKNYFQSTEETAIIDYIKCDDYNEKNEIFNVTLKPALTKMIESIIRRYKLYVPDEEFEFTFNDTISYLLSKINNFDPDKGHKAYSYCGTVAKNYLIGKNIQVTKNKQRYDSYDDLYDDLKNDEKYIVDEGYSDLPEKLVAKILDVIKNMIDNPTNFKLNEKELKVGESLYNLFLNWENIVDDNGSNKFHKSAILYFLRETTMMSTKEIRENMRKFKNAYISLKEKNI